MSDYAILSVQGLTVGYRSSSEVSTTLNSIDLTVRAGEVVGIVGESGSGKSTLAAAITGTLAPSAALSAGSIRLRGHDMNAMSPAEKRRVRRSELGVITQNPITAMDPTRKVARAFADAGVAPADAHTALTAVGLRDSGRVLDSYPHQLSGGMAQRVCIALATSGSPSLVVADEPTSALDAGITDSILSVMVASAERTNAALLIITHDLGIVRRYCGSVVVMKAGRVVEHGPAGDVLARPAEAYTRTLLAASGMLAGESRPAPGRTRKPVIEMRDVSVTFRAGPPWHRTEMQALRDVSLTVHDGEMLGLVGHSGSGKSTLCNLLVGLRRPTSGSVLVDGRPLRSPRKGDRGSVQVVLQHPDWALNPSVRVGASIAEPLAIVERVHGAAARTRVAGMMERLGLDPALADRFPHELSGGQRQRSSIARALIASPKFVVFDEAVSSLDVSVQAQVLREITRLQAQMNFTGIFVSHDAHAVAYVSDRVVEMADGRLAEPSC